MTESEAMAQLHHPGWLSIGEPDVSARIAERGAGYEIGSGCSADEWDWQRRIPVTKIDGTVMVFENPPVGWP